jgi:hypothetical protein
MLAGCSGGGMIGAGGAGGSATAMGANPTNAPMTSATTVRMVGP